MATSEWYGFDWDGTVVTYDRIYAPDEFGEPVPAVVEMIKDFIAAGKEVRIFTARASRSGTTERDIQAQIKFCADRGEPLTYEEALERIHYWNSSTEASIAAIKAWCKQHFGQELEVTCTKDFRMAVLYDDRARHVVFNKGTVCCGCES